MTKLYSRSYNNVFFYGLIFNWTISSFRRIIIRNVTFKAGLHMIADRRSQIADRNKVCDRLRSYGNILLRPWSQTIAEDRTMFYLLRSSAIPCDQLPLCDHMEIKVLRSAIETHPIIFRVLSHDSTLVCLMVGTVHVATFISLSFGGIYGGSCSLWMCLQSRQKRF